MQTPVGRDSIISKLHLAELRCSSHLLHKVNAVPEPGAPPLLIVSFLNVRIVFGVAFILKVTQTKTAGAALQCES